MKTVEEIIASKPEFHNWFDSAEEVFNQFRVHKDERKGINILFASYGGGDYDGEAFVLYEQGGTLWEANGSHCSCFGLEDQWSGEHVVLSELQNRVISGEQYWSYEHNYKPLLAKFLGINTTNND